MMDALQRHRLLKLVEIRANWNPADHPRVPGGEHGGEFVSTRGLARKFLHGIAGLDEDETPNTLYLDDEGDVYFNWSDTSENDDLINFEMVDEDGGMAQFELSDYRLRQLWVAMSLDRIRGSMSTEERIGLMDALLAADAGGQANFGPQYTRESIGGYWDWQGW